jgi:uncharacterized membrane protein
MSPPVPAPGSFESPPPRRHGHEISRLEAFSDAVFGFAATLLVVSLDVPKTFAELLASLQGFAAFALTFTALVSIWAVHNSFFRRYGLEDGVTTVLNSALLFVVLFYVYPLKFVVTSFVAYFFKIGQLTDARIESAAQLAQMFIVYGLGFVAVFLCFALLYHHAWRRRGELGLTLREAFDALGSCRQHLLIVAVGLLSVALAGTGVGLRWGLPGWVYCLIGPLSWAHGAWNDKRRTRLA